MISLRLVALRRGERLLFSSNVNLTRYVGYRVGVVGRNGTGKSSLFAAIRNESEADKGDIDLPGKGCASPAWPRKPRRCRTRRSSLCWAADRSGGGGAAWKRPRPPRARKTWEAVAAAHQKMAESRASTTPRVPARASYCMAWGSRPIPTIARCQRLRRPGWVRLNLARALRTPSDLLLLARAYQPFGHGRGAVAGNSGRGSIRAIDLPRVPRQRRHPHPAPESGRRQALRRRLYPFSQRQRTEQLRQTADRA